MLQVVIHNNCQNVSKHTTSTLFVDPLPLPIEYTKKLSIVTNSFKRAESSENSDNYERPLSIYMCACLYVRSYIHTYINVRFYEHIHTYIYVLR